MNASRAQKQNHEMGVEQRRLMREQSDKIHQLETASSAMEKESQENIARLEEKLRGTEQKLHAHDSRLS